MRLSLFSTVNQTPLRAAPVGANFSNLVAPITAGGPHPEFSLYTYHIHLRGTFQHDKHY